MPETENEGAVATASVPTGNGDVSHIIESFFIAIFFLTQLLFFLIVLTGG